MFHKTCAVHEETFLFPFVVPRWLQISRRNLGLNLVLSRRCCPVAGLGGSAVACSHSGTGLRSGQGARGSGIQLVLQLLGLHFSLFNCNTSKYLPEDQRQVAGLKAESTGDAHNSVN